MKQKLSEGTIIFTHPKGNVYEDVISIKVEDKTSNTQFVEIIVPYAEFSKALGSMHAECKFELNHIENVGKKYEHKSEKIPCFKGGYNDTEGRKKHLAKYEVDGWIGRLDDLSNHHNFTEDGNVNVSFNRWV